MTMRVLICAGGTGGGIYPALAAASELQRLGVPAANILWIGMAGEMEEDLVPRAGLKLETIRGGALVGVSLKAKVMNAAQLTWSVGKAYRLVRQFRPHVMLMTGGYMAAPVSLTAWAQRIPIAIYLPDVEPGAAIKTVMPLARRVACTTDGSAAYVPAQKLVVTGYPVRPELRAAVQMSRAAALAQFDLTPARPTLFVFGGSRGAWNINQALMAALPELLPQVQIIHVSGQHTWPQVAANWERLTAVQQQGYRPFPYLHDEMGAAFRAADLVLARAGASMLGESPAFGLPAILTPLAWAWRYQKVNADFLTQRGAAVQLTDETLAAQLVPTVLGLIQSPARLQAMRLAAQSLDIPDATTRLAQVLLDLGTGGRTHD